VFRGIGGRGTFRASSLVDASGGSAREPAARQCGVEARERRRPPRSLPSGGRGRRGTPGVASPQGRGPHRGRTPRSPTNAPGNSSRGRSYSQEGHEPAAALSGVVRSAQSETQIRDAAGGVGRGGRPFAARRSTTQPRRPGSAEFSPRLPPQALREVFGGEELVPRRGVRHFCLRASPPRRERRRRARMR